MKIKLTSVYVDNQEKALRFYTEVLGLTKKADFSNGPFRWPTVASPDEPERNRATTRSQRQPGGQGVPASHIPAAPARDHVLHRRRQGRLRAESSARRRVCHAADRGDRLDHRPVERHLRQPHSNHPAGVAVGRASAPGRARPHPSAALARAPSHGTGSRRRSSGYGPLPASAGW